MDWSEYENFTKSEFDCQYTGRNKMRPEFMQALQTVRTAFNAPMIVTSGYRDTSHPVERRKSEPGEHTYGMAADIAVGGVQALDLIRIAYDAGFRRIGVCQKGGVEFIHLGWGDKELGFPPSIWSY